MRPEWLERSIFEPQDVRLGLIPTMPRLLVTRQEARDLAAHLTSKARPPEPASLAGADPARGRRLMDEQQCGACHRFTGVPPLAGSTEKYGGRDETRDAVLIAPDHRFTRERSTAAALMAWIREPLKVKKDTLMPQMPLDATERRDVVSYILTARAQPLEPHRIPPRMAVLKRRVGYGELGEKILAVTCRHCHSEPDVSLGDGGIGNTGGLGYIPRGVSFQDHKSTMAGRLDDQGNRRSLFELLADGTPRMVGALLARHAELAGRPSAEIRGMPAYLPPLPPEEIQLVESWVAQGRPR
ncbi:MAG: cytochrome c [Deltaproteobacteria bacterium]|nr:cytochrome c [Deltaproteobacteria bacterium]